MANIKSNNLIVRNDQLLSVEDAIKQGIKLSASVQLLAGIASQLGIDKSISLYEGKGYINEATCVLINSKL